MSLSTGKDTSLSLTVDGIVVEECTAIDFSEKDNMSEIESKPLGCDHSYVKHEFDSWSGSITFNPQDSRIQALVDAYHTGLRNNVPVEINITRTILYGANPSVTHVYRSVSLNYEGAFTRGEANRVTLTWKTGLERI